MRLRIIIFSVFALVYAYFGFSLVLPFEDWIARSFGMTVLALMFAAILWVPLVYWQSESDETTAGQRALLWIAFSSIGTLSFVLVFTLLKDVAALFLPFNLHTTELSGSVVGLSLLCFVIGALLAHHGVRIKETEITIEDLPVELEGLRLVQITDLHVGPTIREAYVEKIVALANEAKADLILVTGDIVDGMVKDLSPQVEPLTRLQATLGKFYVPGNHEFYWEAMPWIEKFRSLGLKPLINAHETVIRSGKSVMIAGVPDPAAAMIKMEGPNFDKAIAGAAAQTFPKVVLCHQPKFAPLAERAGFDLQLSGHTHGGQFYPWTWVARWVHPLNYGLHRVGKMQIYVSRGTGYWGPPVRMGSPAEVSLLILKSSRNSI